MGKFRYFRLLILVAVLFAGIAISLTTAEGKVDNSAASPGFPILGPYLNIWTDAVENSNQAVVYNSVHNEFLVVWTIKQDEWSTDLWARRIFSDGSLSPYFCIATYPGLKLYGADVAYSSKQDRYFVVFRYSRDDDPINTDISAVTFDYDGNNLSKFLEVDPYERILGHPSVAYNQMDDEFLVVYENYEPCIGIYARRFDAQTGLPEDLPQPVKSCGPLNWNRGPDVAYNPSRNNYLISYICFQSNPPDPYTSYMTAKVASSKLSTFSPEFQLSGDGISSSYGEIAAGQDEYLAVWVANDAKIYAQRVNHDGTLPVPGNGFLISSATSDNLSVDVSASSSGYWVVWEHITSFNPRYSDIYGNFIPRGADQALPVEFPIDADINLHQSPRISCRWHGVCLVANSYNLEEYPAGDLEIRGRFLFTPTFYLPMIVR